MTIEPAFVTEPIDIRQPIRELCQRLDLDETYVRRLDITPELVKVELYRGSKGRCLGAKYIDDQGAAAIESFTLMVTA